MKTLPSLRRSINPHRVHVCPTAVFVPLLVLFYYVRSVRPPPCPVLLRPHPLHRLLEGVQALGGSVALAGVRFLRTEHQGPADNQELQSWGGK